MIQKITSYFLSFALWVYKFTHLKHETDKNIIGYQIEPMYKTINRPFNGTVEDFFKDLYFYKN